MERVAVDVGKYGEHQSRQPLGLGRDAVDPGLHRGDDPPIGRDHDPGCGCLATEPRELAPPRLHRHASSSRTSARALTPATQSPGSACSAGEWLTPVGLRTNSMALRTPNCAMTPASCPAAVGIWGTSPSADASRFRRSSANLASADHDSSTGSTPAAWPTAPTTERTRASSAPHTSSHAGTREGTAFAAFDSTVTRRMVATTPAPSALARAVRTAFASRSI